MTSDTLVQRVFDVTFSVDISMYTSPLGPTSIWCSDSPYQAPEANHINRSPEHERRQLPPQIINTSIVTPTESAAKHMHITGL
ncbi:hypothetical protein F2P81_017904 [Scophthalmus maximus]|uniref:Uncharacterized protein n=1 Tax=Scophthalmus maximus TaxID=52904 RepID=A0A6A4S8C5_SCOMX|nr:hypothetical protein F2P81_017904 [Scophthalmus maximus]